ncbi:MAG: tyrosine-type recombinase/integrase [Candidatus Aenigmatarchaeota archaeon]
MKDEVYRTKQRIESCLRKIRNSCIDEDSKQKILEFYQECIVRGYSKERIIKYLVTLERIARDLGKPFVEAKKADIVNLIAKIEQSNYSDWTKHDYKVILRVFYKWLRKEDRPEEVGWIRIREANRHKLPEELLTVEEVNRLVDAADHIRDKAFISTLYESGCRIGELLCLQIRHVCFDNFGAVLLVNGKTGQRRVRVIASASKLYQWYENHPLKENPEAPLWITIGTNSRYKVWTYSTAKEVIKKIARKAGIKKRVYPHLFRHSRATHLASHLTEAQMKQYFGWVQGSDMASIYVHLSGRDVDRALLKLNGIEVQEKLENEKFKAKICPRCKGSNSFDAKFCHLCGMCLDEKVSVEVEELRGKIDQLMTELVKNPEVLEALLKGIEKLKNQSNLSFNEQILSNGNGEGVKGVQKRKNGDSAEDNR